MCNHLYSTSYIEKTDINENVIYAYKLEENSNKWEKITSIDNYLDNR